LVALFIACTLVRYGEEPYPSVAAMVIIHLGGTSGRAVLEQLQALRGGRIVRWPLVILAILVAIGCAGAGALALLLQSSLSGMIPRPADLAAEVWGGALAAVGAVYLLGLAQSRQSSVDHALDNAKGDIAPALWLRVEEAAAASGCDVSLLGAVMVLENAQRPQWFRRLERVKGRLIKAGTYGIMQAYSLHPISDEASIDKIAERLSARRVPSHDEDKSRLEFFRSLALELNGRTAYGDDLASLYSRLEEDRTQ